MGFGWWNMTDGRQVIAVEDGELYLRHSGQGNEHILWVHGLPLNSDAWYGQLLCFDLLCRNTVFDLRGYGKSSKLPQNCTSVTDLYMADFLKVIEASNVNDTVLVGFASAGHAALRFAALYPEKVRKLIIINGSPCFMSQDDWQGGFDKASLEKIVSEIDNAKTDDDIYQMLLDASMNEKGNDEKMAALKKYYMKLANTAGRETVRAFFTDIAYDDDRALLAKICVPTLIISSRLGKEVPSDTALYLRQQIKNAQLFEINDIDHFAYATKKNLINDVIKQFVFPETDILLPQG